MKIFFQVHDSELKMLFEILHRDFWGILLRDFLILDIWYVFKISIYFPNFGIKLYEK